MGEREQKTLSQNLPYKKGDTFPVSTDSADDWVVTVENVDWIECEGKIRYSLNAMSITLGIKTTQRFNIGFFPTVEVLADPAALKEICSHSIQEEAKEILENAYNDVPNRHLYFESL